MLTRRDPGYLENPLRREMFRAAIARLRLTPVMFELGARPHPPRELYRAYPAQTDVFVGTCWLRYGWVAPGSRCPGWRTCTCCPGSHKLI